MKVLFHCWEFPPNGTGVGSYIMQMARALVSCGHHCVIVTGKADGHPEKETGSFGLVLRQYVKTEIGSKRVRCLVLNIAAEYGVDLIEGADHLGECSGLLKVRNRPPVMIKVHSSNAIKVLVRSQMFYNWQQFTVSAAVFLKIKQLMAERYSIRHADLLCVPSQRLRDEIIKQGLRTNGDIGVVPNLIFPVPVSNLTETVVPTVLFVGRIDIGKGVVYLSEIMRNVLKRYPDTVLEIAGCDSYARGLGSIVLWLKGRFGNMMKNVRFLGNLDAENLDAAYRRSWVVVVPSRWDNFPSAVLEAMIRGKPIVTSPHGGMPEILEGTSCRIANPESVEFAEIICEFLADSGLRKRAGESGVAKAALSYSPATVVKIYENFVREKLK